MKKAVMAVAFAGAVGLAGLILPALASPQDADDSGTATGGYGPCWRDGDGRMGYGHGRGMMGGGHGGGPGAWGGHHGSWDGPMGMGPAFGLGPVWRLDLSDTQRAQVNKIADDLRHANWATIGKLQDAQAKLRDLESQSTPDPKKVGATYGEASKLRQDILEASVQARNQVRALLTPAQRQELDQWRGEAFAPGSGMQHRGAEPSSQKQ